MALKAAARLLWHSSLKVPSNFPIFVFCNQVEWSDSPVSGRVSAAEQTGETGCGELFILRQSGGWAGGLPCY